MASNGLGKPHEPLLARGVVRTTQPKEPEMSKLIALVATAVMLNGVRTVIEPGEELPDLSRHDVKELLDSGAAMDPEAQATTEKARKQEEAVAQRAFQEARQRFQDERASTTTAPGSADAGVDGQSGAATADASGSGQVGQAADTAQAQHQAGTDPVVTETSQAAAPAAKGGKKSNPAQE